VRGGVEVSPLDGLEWRHIGPAAFGGRIDDVEAVVSDPKIIFIGAASGGIFKTVNGGTTWKPVFDRDGGSLSIGDIAIAPSDPNIVWAGTGEPNNRQSSSWGDGVYRSLDGGETWTHVGLRDTHHIGRVVIHPRDPDTVFVAALGHLWGPNEERGLYRTRDAGRTWQQVLKIDPDTGVVDVALDRDGRTLFAAAYQRRRRGWGFIGGGTGGGLYRSLDGGDTWQKLEEGLPKGVVGRIGVEISRSHPDVVYAVIEHKEGGGVFRSDDRGVTWTKQSSTNQRPSYYSQIRIDPQNLNKVWMLASPLFVSIDGGKTFTTRGTGDRIHVDHHALWINPADPDHLVLGNDGGLFVSRDGSKTWHFVDNLPIGQYYDISIDGRDPYWVYGGTQDNGTWAVPSRTPSALGIMNADVVNIAYGDGFYTVPDPRDHRLVYANSQSGRTYLVDVDTREEKGIRPVPPASKETYRFNWSTPMLLSPHNPDVVFYGGNKLFRTVDRGHRWEVISPDLTRNDEWKKLPGFFTRGGERGDDTLSRDDGVSDFGTITTISESPLKAGLLYVGTDDGNVQMSPDGGESWQNLASKFRLPGARWVSRVLASRHGAGTAYVTFDGHQDDDFKPYVFRTTNGGDSWSSIAGDLPDGVVVNALEEHPRRPDLLFAGTEFGLYFTLDDGRRWTRAAGNLPRVPVDDIVVSARDNDLILGTHGRSIIILDDMTPLERATPEILSSDAHLFAPRPAIQHYEMRMLPTPGASEFSGPNPAYGALITYYLRDDPPPPAPAKPTSSKGTNTSGPPDLAKTPPPPPTVKITIAAPDGSVVRELEGPDQKGMNRVAWDLRYPLGIKVEETDEGWFGPPKGPLVMPGTYSVKLRARGRELTERVDVRVDPRVKTTTEALQARHAAARATAELQRAFVEGAALLQDAGKRFDELERRVKESDQKDADAAVADAKKTVADLREKFKPGWGGPRFRIFDLAGQLQASTSAPTEAQLRTIDQLTPEVTANVERLNAFVGRELPELERRLAAAGLDRPPLKPVAPPGKR
ncbi:MAG: WD40/YVTN/BNR-like repeat-containing protein, partial [Gaiellales bacterium]